MIGIKTMFTFTNVALVNVIRKCSFANGNNIFVPDTKLINDTKKLNRLNIETRFCDATNMCLLSCEY